MNTRQRAESHECLSRISDNEFIRSLIDPLYSWFSPDSTEAFTFLAFRLDKSLTHTHAIQDSKKEWKKNGFHVTKRKGACSSRVHGVAYILRMCIRIGIRMYVYEPRVYKECVCMRVSLCMCTFTYVYIMHVRRKRFTHRAQWQILASKRSCSNRQVPTVSQQKRE